MTISERYKKLLKAYGANRDKWPADERGLLEKAGTAETFQNASRHEAALDQLLSSASQPDVPAGAQDRLLALTGAGNVLPFKAAAGPMPAKSAASRKWLPGENLAAGMALAASLLFGIYIGATGSIADILPAIVTGGESLETAILDEPLDVGETLDDVEAEG